ncbi:MAG TPA: MFS transporter, partial [Candidatus Levybacteria bacterium]|nr:MFS transporter [Candidatus Levybacteria bacterium]
MGLAPLIAPSLGSFFVAHFTWYYIFYFLFIFSFSVILLISFFLPETSIYKHSNQLRIKKISKEYFEVLNLKSTEDYSAPINTDRIENPTIVFEDVSFSYEKSEQVLQKISFTIHPNETVA